MLEIRTGFGAVHPRFERADEHSLGDLARHRRVVGGQDRHGVHRHVHLLGEAEDSARVPPRGRVSGEDGGVDAPGDVVEEVDRVPAERLGDQDFVQLDIVFGQRGGGDVAPVERPVRVRYEQTLPGALAGGLDQQGRDRSGDQRTHHERQEPRHDDPAVVVGAEGEVTEDLAPERSVVGHRGNGVLTAHQPALVRPSCEGVAHDGFDVLGVLLGGGQDDVAHVGAEYPVLSIDCLAVLDPCVCGEVLGRQHSEARDFDRLEHVVLVDLSADAEAGDVQPGRQAIPALAGERRLIDGDDLPGAAHEVFAGNEEFVLVELRGDHRARLSTGLQGRFGFASVEPDLGGNVCKLAG